MRSNTIIRPAQPPDAPTLAELLRKLDFFDRLADVTAALDRAVENDAHSLLVAVDDEQRLVGYCAAHWIPALYLDGPEGYLSELFVDEDSRGRGVGSALLRSVTDEARRRCCMKLQLINFIHRESYQRGFYAKNGWEERPTAANFALYLE